MSQFSRCCTCALFVCALFFQSSAAHATTLPSLAMPSGGATWGFIDGCPGICAGFSGPNLSLGFEVFIPPVYFNANAGDTFDPSSLLGLHEFIGAPSQPTGSLLLNGTTYPVAYNEVGVAAAPFTVPFGDATVEEPATLGGLGMACTAIYGIYGCFPPPTTTPYPIVVANFGFGVQGLLTVDFHPAFGPGIHNEAFVATFTPVPEPSSAVLLLGAVPLLLWFRRRDPANKKG